VIFNYLINDDAFVSAATADACSMVDLVCLFMKAHLLALLEINVLTWFVVLSRKFSACVKNITVLCQHLPRPIQPILIYQ